jgi:hypothetical protein
VQVPKKLILPLPEFLTTECIESVTVQDLLARPEFVAFME